MAGEDKIKSLWKILFAQNEVLDCMLQEQACIHNEVKNRNWVDLQNSLVQMKNYSDSFVELDVRRELLVGDDRNIYFNPEVSDLLVMVRTKLTKSKIENEALSRYVNATQSFINGVFQECIPQARNVRYGRNGMLLKPRAESVVFDTVF